MALDPKTWMQQLSPDLYLNQISIPGTHDSCCSAFLGTGPNPFAPLLPGATLVTDQIVSALAYTQYANATIRAQLDMGVRYFDLRPKFRLGGASDAPIWHGIIQTTSSLRGALTDMARFVKSTNETVVVRIKEEGDSTADEVTTRFAAIKSAIEADYPCAFYFQETPATAAPPRLARCRGKIVVLAGVAGVPGYPWDACDVQDDYEVEIPEAKDSTRMSALCRVAESTTPVLGLLGLVYGQASSKDLCEVAASVADPVVLRDAVFAPKRASIAAQLAKKECLLAYSGYESAAGVPARTRKFFVNHVSCVGKGADIAMLRPDVCAAVLDKWMGAVLDKLASDTSELLGGRKQIGIIPFDFVTAELARKVYTLNFPPGS